MFIDFIELVVSQFGTKLDILETEADYSYNSPKVSSINNCWSGNRGFRVMATIHYPFIRSYLKKLHYVS